MTDLGLSINFLCWYVDYIILICLYVQLWYLCEDLMSIRRLAEGLSQSDVHSEAQCYNHV